MRCVRRGGSFSFRRQKMQEEPSARSGSRLLSLIQEESDSREHSDSCFLPPIAPPGGAGEGGKAGVGVAGRQKVTSSLPLLRERPQQDGSLLEELGRIEAELRESLRLDEERQREAEFLRRQENQNLRTHLFHLSLSQRLAKPWVSSYFRKFPMHLYCLPVHRANHGMRRRGLSKRK